MSRYGRVHHLIKAYKGDKQAQVSLSEPFARNEALPAQDLLSLV